MYKNFLKYIAAKIYSNLKSFNYLYVTFKLKYENNNPNSDGLI